MISREVYSSIIILLVLVLVVMELIPAFRNKIELWNEQWIQKKEDFVYFIDDKAYLNDLEFQLLPSSLDGKQKHIPLTIEIMNERIVSKNNKIVKDEEEELRQYRMGQQSNDEREKVKALHIEKALERRRLGYGCVHYDGPDHLKPNEFWWRKGILLARDH
jgi:hypothetical protein